MKNVAIGAVFAVMNIVSLFVGIGMALHVYRDRTDRLIVAIEDDEQLKGTKARKYIYRIFNR